MSVYDAEGGPTMVPATPPASATPAQVVVVPPDPPPAVAHKEEAAPPKKKVWTREQVKRTVDVFIYSRMYPDYEPWGFVLRIVLSGDMQKKRDEFSALPPAQADAREDEQVLDELCDLLAQDPTGFGDWPQGTLSPGEKLRAYYNETTDREAKATLKQILRAAYNSYYGKVLPREFFPPSANPGPA